MKPPQEPVCKETTELPAAIHNLKGLDRIAYRIADYASARRWLFERLDRSRELAAWTYRGADDPGIALYEGAALVIDSLTFYQQAYANEAFLRTATWRESVVDLVRLVGYRLKPAIGGVGTFAFEVEGDKPVTIPRGVGLQASLGPDSHPADLETAEEIVALPWLSRLSLVRPQAPGWIRPGTTKLVVAPGTPLTFAKNDRIAIGVLSSDGRHLDQFETVIVEAVESWHGRSVLVLKGAITKITGAHRTLTAVKLGQTFHLTGHNSPASYVKVNASGPPTGVNVNFSRPIHQSRELSLEPQAPQLALGTRLAVQMMTHLIHRFDVVTFEADAFQPVVMQRTVMERPVMDVPGNRVEQLTNPLRRFELASITDARSETVSFGPLSVPSTIVTLDAVLGVDLPSARTFDIRTVQVDAIEGAPFSVGATWSDITAPATHLAYWGDSTRARDAVGRRVGIAPAGKPSYSATVLDVQSTGDVATFILDRDVDVADFGEGNKTVVYGNLADVTEGKRVKDTVLGNGDDRAVFQSFKLPKTPLTYLEHPELTPPEQPELEVIVTGRIWKHVPVLFGQPGDAEVYVVRQDENGDSWVQFGDGKTGSRLPSGVDNVSARYRTGAGAHGPLADGAKPSADRTVKQITDVNLIGLVAGGADPEDEATAKLAAPARVQSLDRIVSITDVEAEALAIGGVARARAIWTIAHGVPVVQVTLLMQEGRTAELEHARAVLAMANRKRGPDRFPIVVVPGAFEYLYLDLSIAIDPELDPRPVREAVRDALVADRSRVFGDAEYATRLEGIAQNVPGVRWALVNAFGSLGVVDDPATLKYPAAATRAEVVRCASTHVLRLYSGGDDGPFQLRIAAGDA